MVGSRRSDKNMHIILNQAVTVMWISTSAYHFGDKKHDVAFENQTLRNILFLTLTPSLIQ